MPHSLWRLIYPGVDLSFGGAGSGILHASVPDVGDVEIRADDQVLPRADGRAFGVDFGGGRTVSFDLLVLGADEPDTRGRVAAMAAAWRAGWLRQTPGAVAALLADHAGRVRVAYGRPRRFAPVDKHTGQGVGRVVADFACVDDCWYAPDPDQTVLGLVPPPSGGLLAPLAAPLATTAPTQTPGVIVVGGDLPAWPVIGFQGPIVGPQVSVTGGWTLTLAATIPAGETVTVDTRPWSRTVTTSSGASWAGALTRGTPRLADMALPPGRWEIALRGQDVSGTAKVRFRWQNTYATL